MKKVVFTFGRINPPHIGHKKLFDRILVISNELNCDHYIFLSNSYDKDKNPLPPEEKIIIVSKLFPKNNFINSPKIKTIVDVVKNLSDKGYKDIIMVVGEDRCKAFKSFNNYLEDFNINSFNVVSAGERDPDTNGIIGASASKVRDAVKANDYDAFDRYMPVATKTIKHKLFESLRNKLLS